MLRATAYPLAAALLPRAVAFAFAALQLDAVVDWGATSAAIAAAEAASYALGGALLVALFALDVAAPLRRVLLAPAWLWRVPRDRAWPALLLLGLLATWPVAAVGLLVPPWTAVSWWFASAVCAVALAARRRGVALAAVCAGALPVGAVVLVGLLGGLAVGLDRQRVAGGRRTTSTMPARGPVHALVRLDLLTLRRTAPATLVVAGLAGPTVAMAQTAARVNGPNVGFSATRAGVLALVVLAPLLASAAEALARGLGPNLDRGRWPITPRQRMTALSASLALVFMPAWLGLQLGGAGVWGPLHLGAVVAVLATGAGAALVWRPTTQRSHTLGLHLWLAMTTAVVAWQPAPGSSLALLGMAAGLHALGAYRLAAARRRP